MNPKYQELLVKAGNIKRENMPFQLDTNEFKALVVRVANETYAENIQVEQISSSEGMHSSYFVLIISLLSLYT